VGGGVQLGPLGTAATNKPIMPAPGDYDVEETGGMMIGRGNRSTRRKPAPVQLCPPQTPHAYPDANPARRGWKPATNTVKKPNNVKSNLFTFFHVKFANRILR
jgi:hypothetical protein